MQSSQNDLDNALEEPRGLMPIIEGNPPLPTPTTREPESLNDGLRSRLLSASTAWKRKLLDLGKTNRALNFRVNKVSTITIVDEQPAEVFRQLYLKEQVMKFKAAPEQITLPISTTESLEPTTNIASDFYNDEEEDVSLQQDFVPYDPSSLNERHTDDSLQTASTLDMLDKSLRRLDEQARASLEEQGVNTLFLALGMLNYIESDDSEKVFRAPLILLPVELSRKSARSGYTISAADEDPIVNLALVEYLKHNYGITLPELPELSSINDDYDIQSFFTGAAKAISNQKTWAIKNDIYLGLFSFQKFVMFKDLEANQSALLSHKLIRQLVARDGDNVVGLPDVVRNMKLDEEYPPESTFQVVDADSSQLRAIAAVSRKYDLVIEGPPGTGKSQTITNLIAGGLATGKSVLFVAEKMAALSVVHDRLVRAGLGEFCLELHSSKINKRQVMSQLSLALDASLQGVGTSTASTQRLPNVRTTLTEYVRTVHAPFGTLGISPYRAYGELGRVINAPRVKYSGTVDSITPEQLDDTVRDIKDMATAAKDVMPVDQHPWRDSTKTFYSHDDIANLKDIAQDLAVKADDIIARVTVVREAFNLPPIETFADIDTASAIAEVLARSPGAPLAVLSNNAWNAPPPEAVSFIKQGRELVALKERVEGKFVSNVLEQNHESDIAYVEHKSQGIFSFLAFLDGRYRAIKKRWVSYRLPNISMTLVEQANEMKQVDNLQEARKDIENLHSQGRTLFGELWNGEQSDWSVLENYVKWVVEFRSMCVQHGLSEQAIEVASHKAPNVSDVTALRTAAQNAREQLRTMAALGGWPADYLVEGNLKDLSQRTKDLAVNSHLGPRWAAFESTRQAVAASLAAELLPIAMSGEIAFAELAPAFLRAFYLKWVSAVINERPILEKFHTLTHEERLNEFRALDERVLYENRAALVSKLRDQVQYGLQQKETSVGLPFLKKEMAKKSRHAPLRVTMQRAGPSIRTIKPCLLMSPLTAAQLIDGSVPSFDLVIFDEASQLPAEDAVGSIIRGKQLVVVGDPKQLPPTNFFSVSSGMSNVELGEDGTPLYDDAESILEEFMGASIPMQRLKWHYRSAHESLISFSNVSFYDADLYTFPSVETGTDTYGLQFEHVPNGVYEGKGLNLIEARRVADEVVRFAKEQLERKARGEITQSLGVGTFNLRQQLAVQDELEQRRRDDPSIEPFFNRGVPEPFFVKNLENIQGDERDVIFISVTYARAADGKLRYNFGPINGENGWRRLNVLTTRARQRMRVFSSMRGDEINAAGTTSRGAHLLREFLLYAERGRLESVSASLAADTESPFEQDVLNELTRRGIKVVPQVGMAGYRIDLGVLDDVAPGKFLCGIECDGVAYHSSETARDRDRLRQQVLEARGWTIHRVWSTDWFKDRPGQIERLLKLIDGCRVAAREEAESDRLARARAAEEHARQEAEDAKLAAAAKAAFINAPVETPYIPPVAAQYVFASSNGQYSSSDIMGAPKSQLLKAIVTVVETESPIHETDLFSRVAGMWGTRAGSRIQDYITETCRAAQREKLIQKQGQFYWIPEKPCVVRSRDNTRIPADRIAPQEYEKAILAVLENGHGFSRPQLITEVRTMFGFSRTGAALDEAIGGALDSLMAQGRLGEGSTGIKVREGIAK